MEQPDTPRGFGPDTRARIGIADVVRVYGIDDVHRRIEELRDSGMRYAAIAIELELEAATEPEGLLHRRSA